MDVLLNAGANTTFVLKPLTIARDFLDGAQELVSTGHPLASKRLEFCSRVTRVFSSIGLFFALVDVVDGGFSIKKAVEAYDDEGIALCAIKEATTVLDCLDKAISVARGGVGVFQKLPLKQLQALQASVPWKQVAKGVSVISQAVIPINGLMFLFGLTTSSIELSRVVKVAKSVRAIQKEIDKKPVDLQALEKLLDKAIGVGETDKVSRMAEKITHHKQIESLKGRTIRQKKAAFTRGSSAKALRQMEALKQAIKDEKPIDPEQAQRVFCEMRTLLLRRIVMKAIEVATNAIQLVCMGLFYTPIAPFVPLFLCGGCGIAEFALTLYERFGLEKGLDVLNAEPAF